jgi:subtilisin family serine protease
MYPAAYEQVISVTATTPLDKKKELNDQWNTGSAWAPNYGKKLHIGAPGLCIPTTDFSGSAGYSQANYITFSKTSSAAPVVSGLAALLLSKNQSLTWQEVKQKIADGADKIGGYNYSYDSDKPGHSKETGYGRINAYKTLDAVNVSVEEVVANAHKINIKVENPVNQALNIHYDVTNNNSDIEMRIFNTEGKLFYQQPLNIAEKHVALDVADLPAGMYFSKFFIRDEEEEYLETVKFVKLW